MSNALSMDLRNRFKQVMEEDHRASEAGRILRISRATAARWGRKVREEQVLEPLHSGPAKGVGKLEEHFAFLEELIGNDSDIDAVRVAGGIWFAMFGQRAAQPAVSARSSLQKKRW